MSALDDEPRHDDDVPDDRLRLMFTCCHPALSIGRAGRPDAAHAGRHVHGRDRPGLPGPRADHGPAAGPGQAQDPPRRHPLRRAARRTSWSSGSAPCSPCSTSCSTRATRPAAGPSWSDAGSRSRRSGWPRRCARLMPDEPEALGLLALMLFHDARRARRASGQRASWSCWPTRTARCGTPAPIAEGRRRPRRLGAPRPPGPLPAAGGDRRVPRRRAGARHGLGRGRLALRRAVGHDAARRSSPSTAPWRCPWTRAPRPGWRSSTTIVAGGVLGGYHLLPAARADMLRRLGRDAEAAAGLPAGAGAGRHRGRAPLPRTPGAESRRGQRSSGPV